MSPRRFTPEKQDLLRMNVTEMQHRLTSLIGTAGREDDVREFIYGALSEFVDKIWIDPLGNVLAEKTGSNPKGLKILLDAHMDEIGFMVKFIDDKGFVRITPIGGIDKRLFPGARVLLRTAPQTTVSGIIGMKPPHITSAAEREKVQDPVDLFVDVGTYSKEETEALDIQIGTIGVFATEFEYIEKLHIMRGKAFDDRTGCNILLQIGKLLSEIPKLENTILFAFTIGEEVGARGTGPAAFQLEPDLGIAIENTIAADVPGVSGDKNPTSTRSGPAISIADHSCVYDKRIIDAFVNLGKLLGISTQPKLPTYGGTDAGKFHLIGKGIPAGGLSVPCRYIHSATGQLYVPDMLDTIELLLEFITDFKELKY